MASKKIKGITVQIGGDTSGLTKALTSADKALAATNRELNEVKKGLKLDPSNVTLTAQKQELLAKAINETANKLKALEDNQEKAKKAFEANADWEKQYAPLKEAIDKASSSLKELKEKQSEAEKAFKAGTISAEDYEKIKADVENAEQALTDLKQQKADLDKQFEDGHISAEDYRAYQREVEKTKKELENLRRELHDTGESEKDAGKAAEESGEDMRDAGKDAQKYGDDVKNAGKEIDDFKDQAVKDFKSVVKAAAAITAALIAIGKRAVETGAEFDKSMSGVAATMGYTWEELNIEGTEAAETMKMLRDFAMDMGKSTAFSANEASEGLNYLALSGKTAEESIAMLPRILNLASSGEMELATASDMVTDAQSALGLSIDDTNVMIDQMAKTASKSNTSVSQLGEAMLTIGATGRTAKGGTKELAQVLGLLADNGIKGSEGGTKLRNIILALQSPTDKAAMKLEKLGVSAYDSEGHFRELHDIFDDLNAALEDMSDQDRDIAKSTIFSKRDLAAVNALLGTTSQRWDELGAAIEDSAGAAQDMADVKLDNLAGDVTLFKSALEGAEITISDRLTPTLRKTVQLGTEMVGRLADGFGAGGLAGAVEQAHKVLAEQLGEDAKLIYGVETALDSLIAAFVTFKAASLLASTIAALQKVNTLLAEGKTLTEALNAAKLANPYVLIATAAIGAATAIKKVINIQTDLIDETADSYDKLNDKQKEVADTAKQVSDSVSASRKAWKTENQNIEKQADSYRDLAKELYKLDSQQQINAADRAAMKAITEQLNGSIEGLNIELDEETGHLLTQRETIDKLIDSYERQAKAAAAQERLTDVYIRQIDAQKSVKQLTNERTAAQEKLNSLQDEYNDKTAELAELTKQANEGWTTGETNERIQTLTADVQGLTDAIAEQSEVTEEVETRQHEAQEVLRNAQDDLDTTKQVIAEMGDTLDETAAKTDKDTKDIAEDAAAMKESIVESFDIEEEVNSAVSKIEEIIKAYDDKLASRTGTLQSWFDINATVSGDDAKFGTLSKALDKQIAAMSKWEKDIARLEKEGINENFLDKIKDAGPQSQALVTELLKVPQKERNEYASKWNEAYQGAANIAEKQLSAMKAQNEAIISDMIVELEKKSPEFKSMWESLGGDAIDGYIDGLRDGKKFEELKNAVKEMVDAALDETAEEQDSHSPSKKTKKLGGDFGEGYVKGIEDKMSEAVKAASKMVSATVAAAGASSSTTSSAKMPDIYTARAQLAATKEAAASSAAAQQVIVQQPTVTRGEIVSAVTEALKTISGDVVEAVYLDSDVLAAKTYKKIDVLIAKDAEMDTKGYANA